MLRAITLGLCLLAALTACQAGESDRAAGTPGPFAKAETRTVPTERAVYFVAEGGGEIDGADLEGHPEVKVVHRFDDLKTSASEGIAIWIDKNAAEQVDLDWLRKPPQQEDPIALIGYGNPLYAFREKLNAFGIEGPRADWNHEALAPGFSVWMWRDDSGKNRSAWNLGYREPATVDNVRAVTDALLDGKEPPAPPEAFDADQAVAAVLREHPEYPAAGEKRSIETMTGGPAPGLRVGGTLATAVEAADEPDTYIVTLTKRWELQVNDHWLVGYWRYKATPSGIELLASEDNTDEIELVK